MQIDLSGHRALVTGSTAGIGLAIATGLAEAGAVVVMNGRTDERVREAVASVRQQVAGAEVEGVAADLSTAEGCDALVDAAGAVDVLVNNAGAFTPKPYFDLTDDDWEFAFALNVMAGVRLSRALVPAVVERRFGRVVFISSESALHIPPEMVQYGMTKTAQLAVARGLAESVPGSGVTVNSVLPGPTTSEGFNAMLEQERRGDEPLEETGRRFVAENRPTSILQRPTSPQEVANMVVYVCSRSPPAPPGRAARRRWGRPRHPVTTGPERRPDLRGARIAARGDHRGDGHRAHVRGQPCRRRRGPPRVLGRDLRLPRPERRRQVDPRPGPHDSARNPAAVNSSFILFFPFAFLTTSFLPKDALTGWLAAIATYNPVTYLLEGLRALVAEGWVWASLGKAAAAIVVVAVISMGLAFSALRGRLRSG